MIYYQEKRKIFILGIVLRLSSLWVNTLGNKHILLWLVSGTLPYLVNTHDAKTIRLWFPIMERKILMCAYLR